MNTKDDKTGEAPEGVGWRKPQPQKRWPVLTRRQDGYVPVDARPGVEVAERPPIISEEDVALRSSSPSFSSVDEVSPQLTNVMPPEHLWELAALGESLSDDLPETPYSPLPASTTRVPPSVEVAALLPELTDTFDQNWFEAEKSWDEADTNEDITSTPQPIDLGEHLFQADGSFAQTARPTLQLTPPTYHTPRTSRRPSIHLWCGMLRVLSTSYVSAHHTRRHPPKK